MVQAGVKMNMSNNTLDVHESLAYWKKEEKDRKLRHTYIIQVVLFCIISIFLIRAILWGITPRILSLSAVFISLAISYILSKKKNQKSAVDMLIASLAIAAFVAVSTSGGIYTVASGWILLIPLIAGFLSGPRTAMVWAFFLIILVCLMMVLEHLGFQWRDFTPESQRLSQLRIHIAGQLIAISIILVSFLNQFSRYEVRIKEHIHAQAIAIAKREEAEKQALYSSRAKTQFLSNMSHQLRTPLNSVIGFSARLLKKKSTFSPVETQAINTIHKNGNILLCAVNELIELANLESEETQLKLMTIDISLLINEVLDIQDNQHRLTFTCNKHHAIAQIDVELIRYAFIKLLRFIASQEPNPRTLHVEIDDCPNEPYCTVKLLDLQSTSKAQELDSLFSPTNKTILTAAGSDNISSLALVITANILAKHQGSISVEPSTSGGVFYRICLPKSID